MNSIARAVIASSMFAASSAFAQDVEMNIHADDIGMPSTSISVEGMSPDGNPAGVNMEIRGGGTRMEVNVSGTGTPPPSGRHERRERHEHREEVAPREPPVRHVRHHSEPAFRDCGTNQDPGCTMQRNGHFAMDAETFHGFMQSLKSTHNELTREEMVEKVMKRAFLTAKQFGLVLDLFKNEITRLDVAKTAAPRVVNPQHALGFSSKWRNSISADEYVEIITEQ
ncbi:DUF4476 domain-containing protein [Myxococcus xanthus]|uniref:DUF4476 domain-containing protein n=1 Tax=Myxococcus xanthus TaxID=34 RepID=A0AAE6G576_MYXXA|nr:DUF4476 domain-containing protein [Myxococcus xanthus]QDE71148.1 DUF4476 domain-containing protein [Myxococcus xanthus]QDE78428.1 DUF4476 domain-containing protein [Myxococcus xanthus]